MWTHKVVLQRLGLLFFISSQLQINSHAHHSQAILRTHANRSDWLSSLWTQTRLQIFASQPSATQNTSTVNNPSFNPTGSHHPLSTQLRDARYCCKWSELTFLAPGLFCTPRSVLQSPVAGKLSQPNSSTGDCHGAPQAIWWKVSD